MPIYVWFVFFILYDASENIIVHLYNNKNLFILKIYLTV